MTDPKRTDTPGDRQTDEPAATTEGVDEAPAETSERDDGVALHDTDAETTDDRTGGPLREAAPGGDRVRGRWLRRAAATSSTAAAGPTTAPTATRAATPSDAAVHVDDRVSAAYVVLVALVFVGILLWGLLGGHGGALVPKRSPNPSPSVSPSASIAASSSVGVPGSAGTSASGSAAAGGSPASASPSASPSAP